MSVYIAFPLHFFCASFKDASLAGVWVIIIASIESSAGCHYAHLFPDIYPFVCYCRFLVLTSVVLDITQFFFCYSASLCAHMHIAGPNLHLLSFVWLFFSFTPGRYGYF